MAIQAAIFAGLNVLVLKVAEKGTGVLHQSQVAFADSRKCGYGLNDEGWWFFLNSRQEGQQILRYEDELAGLAFHLIEGPVDKP